MHRTRHSTAAATPLAALLLLGAQVIAEYERIDSEPLEAPVQSLTTEQR